MVLAPVNSRICCSRTSMGGANRAQNISHEPAAPKSASRDFNSCLSTPRPSDVMMLVSRDIYKGCQPIYSKIGCQVLEWTQGPAKSEFMPCQKRSLLFQPLFIVQCICSTGLCGVKAPELSSNGLRWYFKIMQRSFPYTWHSQKSSWGQICVKAETDGLNKSSKVRLGVQYGPIYNCGSFWQNECEINEWKLWQSTVASNWRKSLAQLKLWRQLVSPNVIWYP